jgi:hypothetical protein
LLLLLPPHGPGKPPLSRGPLWEASPGRRWFPLAEQRLPALALRHPFNQPQVQLAFGSGWWPGWDAELIELPVEVLVCESKSRMYDGLWLMEPEQFLFDGMPRAERYLRRFPPPPSAPQQGEVHSHCAD